MGYTTSSVSRTLGEEDSVSESVSLDESVAGSCSPQKVFDDMTQAGNTGKDKMFDELQQPNTAAAGPNQPQGEASKPLWSSLFVRNRDLSQGIKLHTCDNDSSIVIIGKDDIDIVEEKWGYCLIGYYAGKYPGNIALKALCGGWGMKHRFFHHSSGWLVFKFKSEEDRLKVLNGGPYFSYNRQLLLKYMPTCFEFDKADISTIPLWITLPSLPIVLWTEKALSTIVTRVGKPIATDKLTQSRDQISYARALVEVDISKDLVREIVKLPNTR